MSGHRQGFILLPQPCIVCSSPQFLQQEPRLYGRKWPQVLHRRRNGQTSIINIIDDINVCVVHHPRPCVSPCSKSAALLMIQACSDDNRSSTYHHVPVENLVHVHACCILFHHLPTFSGARCDTPATSVMHYHDPLTHAVGFYVCLLRGIQIHGAIHVASRSLLVMAWYISSTPRSWFLPSPCCKVLLVVCCIPSLH
jgi:hypothetical protein